MVQVWDRIDLILKIFAKHAHTAEAKLQITLASIQHMGPRIYRMGMDLSQQGGGIGTRGAGETNTEKMRRHLAAQADTIRKKLEHFARVRETHRKGRERAGMRTAAIVGYTNAGKSSLLNALTRKGAYVADELFATLDTRVGKLRLGGAAGGVDILLSDTIGFIQDLPPSLVAAFRSTLEEAVHADLLLHVVDASDPRADEKVAVVEDILCQLGAMGVPRLRVWNKTDAAGAPRVASLRKSLLGRGVRAGAEPLPSFYVSARSGEGLEELKAGIADFFLKIHTPHGMR